MAPTPTHFLPEPVIHNILAFLPPKDAIRASASSKQWRSAWISSPVVSFDESSVPFKGPDFFDYANRSLELWLHRCHDDRFTMETLSLCADLVDEQSFSRFVQLVAVATTKRNFKVIELRSCSEDFWVLFNCASLWSLLFESKSLEVLRLKSFGILMAGSLVTTCSLKELIVSCSCIDDNSLKNLLSCFPLLENLVLEYCFGFSELRVSCPELRTMKVSYYDCSAPNVAIEAKNLRSFVYIRSLNTPGGISFLNCKLLTSLQIERVDFGPPDAIDEYISQIPLLENLAILDSGLTGTGSFQISHSNLKSLKIQDCWGLSKAEINTPNLCFFKYGGSIFQLSTFRYCSSGLLKAEVEVATGSLEWTQWFWFINLRNFLESFTKCKALTVHCYLQGFPEELEDHCLLPDPLYEVKHLNITNRKLPTAGYARLVGAMIELFPCVETLFLKTGFAKIFIEFGEDRSFSLNWQETINISDSDEHNRIFQSISEAIDDIVKWLSWTGKDTPNRTGDLHPHTVI
ncbi:F-box domain containing protein [Trema orientale]|uniref:F-box domain containing protein n=1 Tax=Trema orientale TaxID=63057 RepID=A0A2P5BIC3_TREOI|nr:F-box domain containing protein [Trema orientale]